MTLINRLIKEAKGGAAELLLPENHIGAMAQNISDTTGAIPRIAAERLLRAGEICLLGVPVRVVPRQREGSA